MNNEGIAQFDQQRERLATEIARLQQRQRELVQEAASMLEEEARTSRAPLEVEIQELRNLLETSDKEREALRQEMADLKNAAERHFQGLEQELRTYIQASTDNLQEIHGRITGRSLAVIKAPEVAVPAATIVTPTPEKGKKNKKAEVIKVKEPKPERQPGRKRHLARRALTFALTVLLAYFGTTRLPHHFLNSLTPGGQVAGVTTERTESSSSSTNTPNTTNAAQTEDQYLESKVDLPFKKTTWDDTSQPDFGVKMSYPTNTSNLVQVIGGSNFWILRKDSYLMKFTILDVPATSTLDQWWTENQATYQDGGTVSTTKFKNLPAIAVRPPDAKFSGMTYYIRRTSSILQIFVADLDPASDDGQRLTKMLASLQITAD